MARKRYKVEAKILAKRQRKEYNTFKPHSLLGGSFLERGTAIWML